MKPSPKTVATALKVALMPFLRCAVLFFNYMTDIAPTYTENDKLFKYNFKPNQRNQIKFYNSKCPI